MGISSNDIAAARAAFELLLDEIEKLTTRQQELLATIVRLTNEVPFPDEVAGWTATRAAMVAEIGTLRSQVEDLTRENRDLRQALEAFQKASKG